jgi:NADH:ubiquinone oxidoreductase subunit 3 (subunit A)
MAFTADELYTRLNKSNKIKRMIQEDASSTLNSEAEYGSGQESPGRFQNLPIDGLVFCYLFVVFDLCMFQVYDMTQCFRGTGGLYQ